MNIFIETDTGFSNIFLQIEIFESQYSTIILFTTIMEVLWKAVMCQIVY